MADGEPGVFTHSVPNRSPTLIIVSIVFLLITTGFFAFRQGWRWAHRQRGWDDVMAACAYTILLIQTIFGGIAVHYGFGKHVQDIKPTYSAALKYFYLYQICYKLLGGFTKLTFCALYLRIFNQRGFQRAVTVVAVIVGLGSLAFALGTVLQCNPVHRAWNHKVPGHCISNTRFWYSHAAFNTFWDIVIYIMPIPMIRTLKLARGQKTGLISIFCLGAFVIAASIVRMVMLRSSAGSTDPTWGSMIALVWTEIEANTSVICCCLPALRVPILNLWHRMRGVKRSPSVPTVVPHRDFYDDAWTGPHQSHAVVSQAVTKPQNSHLFNDIRGNVNGNNSRSGHTQSSGARTVDTWYDRVMKGIDKDKDNELSRSESQEELSQAEKGLPPLIPFGDIYKTTKVQVSTEAPHRHSKPQLESDERRHMSLQEMLNEK